MDALADGHDTDELVNRVLAPFEEQATAFVPAAPIERVATGRLDPGDFIAGEVDHELREIFEEEATELIASFTRGALMLVSAPDRPALLTGLRRDAHTLKGAANMTGFPLIGSLGSSIETLLDAHIDGSVPVERETLGVVLSARKLLTGMLASLDDLVEFVEPAQALNERANAITARIAPAGLPNAEADEEFTEDILTAELPALLDAQTTAEPAEPEPTDVLVASTKAAVTDEPVAAELTADSESDVQDEIVLSDDSEPVAAEQRSRTSQPHRSQSTSRSTRWQPSGTRSTCQPLSARPCRWLTSIHLPSNRQRRSSRTPACRPSIYRNWPTRPFQSLRSRQRQTWFSLTKIRLKRF
jgi:chemotaxis protein histidine kinase CheA